MAWLVVVVVLLSVSVSLAANPRRELQLIAMYFDKGHPYQVIVLFLAAFHGIIMHTCPYYERINLDGEGNTAAYILHRVGRYIMVS